MKGLKFSILIITVLAMSGCVTAQKTALTPLEIQSLQTREYENSMNVVFPSVMSVFQDLGYTVKSADKSTGFITAESAAKSDSASKFLLGISNVTQTSATAFVEEIANFTKVRLNFVTSSNKSYGYGQTDRQDTPILDAEVYQNAFERIENAIFIRSDN